MSRLAGRLAQWRHTLGDAAAILLLAMAMGLAVGGLIGLILWFYG